MTRAGMRAAEALAMQLPRFGSREEARRELYALRDRGLVALIQAALRVGGAFTPDGQPDSLKSLEAWYFDLHERDAFGEIDTTRQEFERWMALYYGEVVVMNNTRARWVVEEYAFAEGRYELGVREGELTEMLTSGFTDHFAVRNNKRRQSIYRRYHSYHL